MDSIRDFTDLASRIEALHRILDRFPSVQLIRLTSEDDEHARSGGTGSSKSRTDDRRKRFSRRLSLTRLKSNTLSSSTEEKRAAKEARDAAKEARDAAKEAAREAAREAKEGEALDKSAKKKKRKETKELRGSLRNSKKSLSSLSSTSLHELIPLASTTSSNTTSSSTTSVSLSTSIPCSASIAQQQQQQQQQTQTNVASGGASSDSIASPLSSAGSGSTAIDLDLPSINNPSRATSPATSRRLGNSDDASPLSSPVPPPITRTSSGLTDIKHYKRLQAGERDKNKSNTDIMLSLMAENLQLRETIATLQQQLQQTQQQQAALCKLIVEYGECIPKELQGNGQQQQCHNSTAADSDDPHQHINHNNNQHHHHHHHGGGGGGDLRASPPPQHTSQLRFSADVSPSSPPVIRRVRPKGNSVKHE
jgi:hypothetical protein